MLRIKVSPMTAMEEEMEALRKENACLRKENLFLNLMSQDVFDNVVENLHLHENKNTAELWKEFNDKFDFDGFCQAYHEYVQEHHLNPKCSPHPYFFSSPKFPDKWTKRNLNHPDFDDLDWNYFWNNYDECVERNRCADVDWKDIFDEQIQRCRRCDCANGCECSEESDEDNEAGVGGEETD